MPSDFTRRAQFLRNNATKQKNELWYKFLRRYPVHFYRQKVIGSYIVDFYCPTAKLVIELDGVHHNEPAQAAYDLERTRYLNTRGLCVLRFHNKEVDYHMRYVCNTIQETVKQRILEL